MSRLIGTAVVVWVIAALAILSPPSVVKGQVPMTGAGLGAPGGAVACDATHGAAGNFLARTSGLNATHQNAYVTLICGGVTDGWWSKMDAFYIFATADSTTAGLNLVSSSFTITAHGPPTFTADAGYTGTDNTTSFYLDTGYNLSTGTNYTQNSAHVSCWNNASATTSNPCFSVTASGGDPETDIYPKFSGDGHSYFRVNDSSGSGGTTPAGTPIGQFIASRTGASTQQGYYNGASQGLTSVTSGTPPNCNLFILAVDVCGTGITTSSNYQVMEASAGGGLTGTDASNFCARVGAFLHTINGLTSPC